MKKLLLGSSALLSAALLSQGAQAADQPVKLAISGYYQAGYLVTLHENSGPAGTYLPDSVGEYGLLNFSGDTKFEDGLGAGVFIQAYAFDSKYSSNTGGTGLFRQSWAHLTGAEWGEVRIGDQTDVRRAVSVAAPEFANYLFGVNSPDLIINNGPGRSSNTTTAPLGGSYATSVAYYSPTTSGFQFSASYAPDNIQGEETFPHPGAYDGSSTGHDQGLRDKYSTALTWSGTLSGISLNASAAISGASVEKNVTTPGGLADPFIYTLGYSMSVGPWAIGAGYEQYNNSGGEGQGYGVVGTSETSNKTTDIGFTYTIGNVTAGAEISRGSYKNWYAAAEDEGDFGAKVTPVLTQAILGATYLLGPGVSVSGALGFNDWDNNKAENVYGPTSAAGTSNGGYDSVQLMLGTNINF